jgi:hypothetical protein
MKGAIKLLLALLVIGGAALAQDVQPIQLTPFKETATSPAITISGTPVFFADKNGSVSELFEILVSGGPSALSVSIYGCGNNSCTTSTIGTSSGTGSQPIVTAGGYNRYEVVSTFSGGTSPSVTIIRWGFSGSPSSTSGGGSGGTVNQGTPGASASAGWWNKLTDGTNGPVAVKPASTAPLATDPSLVVTISPNSPSASVPTGTAGSPATQVVSVQGVAGGTVVPISAASLPLPTGAATSANQATPGTAGSPSAQVLSVQGVGSGTALPVSLATAPTTPTQPAGFGSAVGFQQAVTTSAVALATNSTHGFCVQALSTNALTVYVGPTGITTSTGFPLGPGQGVCYQLSNTNVIFVVASSTGSSVAVTGA